MKTKFTPKQIATFQSMIDNGILEHICNNDEEGEAILTNIGERFGELDEGRFLREQMTVKASILAADECGELGYLASQSLGKYCRSNAVNKEFEKNVLSALEKSTGNTYMSINNIDARKEFIKILRLRSWATKEDILKEADERL